MAGVINNTARQYNLKAIRDGKRYVIRLVPGFNSVDDTHFKAFLTGKKVSCDYLQSLIYDGKIEYNAKTIDMELTERELAKTKSKVEGLPPKMAAAILAKAAAEAAKEK